jgi:hypothetical protein
VSGASVAISGESPSGRYTQTYATDSAGELLLDRQTLLSPAPAVDVVAPAFVTRNTLLRSEAETRFSLWPKTSPTGLDEDVSATLVYSPSSCPAQSTGAATMRRVSSSVRLALVGFAAGLQDQTAEDVHRTAIGRLNSAIGGAVTYDFSTTRPATGVFFSIQIDATDSTCSAGSEVTRAAAYLTLTNGEITGGRLVYCTLVAARDFRLVLHELGHTYGLYHSSSTRDVMYCTVGRPPEFSAREALVMSLMRQRRSGNRWPDDDRLAAAPLGARETFLITCSG